MIFAPLSPPKAKEVSDDFEAIALFVSSEFASEAHDTRNLMMTLILTLNQPESPVIKLTEEEMKSLVEILNLFIVHQKNSNTYTYDALHSLYGLYLADLMGIIERRGLAEHCSIRSYKLFLDFSKLLIPIPVGPIKMAIAFDRRIEIRMFINLTPPNKAMALKIPP